MKPEIEPFPQNREEINSNKLKFLSQTFAQWLRDLPSNFHTDEVSRKFLPVFGEIILLAENASIVSDGRINRVEKRIQEFMDAYKAGVIQAYKTTSGEKLGEGLDYQIHGNEIFSISFDLLCFLQQITINELIKSRGNGTDINREVEVLLVFFERFFGKVESNDPISKDDKYLEQVQKAIKLILDYSRENEIFEKNTLQRLADFRSSIQ